MAQTEVRQGRFVYRDALFVEVEGDKRHARASPTELKDLLLPQGRNTASSSSDQVGHFYQAQLVHYGSSFTRDKRGATLRLIEAINSKTLHVPIEIRNIEADLKKQYAAEVRKIKSAAKREHDSNTTRDKRKRKSSTHSTSSGQNSATKVSIKIGDVVVDVDHSSNSAQDGVKRQRRALSNEPERTKFVNEKNPNTARSSPLASIRPATSPLKTRSPRPTLRRQKTPTRNTPRSNQPSRSSNSNSPIVTPDTPPPPYSAFTDNDSPDHCIQPRARNNDAVQISGDYILTIVNARIEGSCSMQLYLSNSRDQLWGTFTVGCHTGVLRLDDISDIGRNAQKTLGWRAEYTPTGRLKFGKGCDGRVQFDGNGGAYGCLNGLIFGQDVVFEAVLDESFGHHSEDEREYDVQDLQRLWDDFPERAYGRV